MLKFLYALFIVSVRALDNNYEHHICHLYGGLCSETQTCIEGSKDIYRCECKQGYAGENCEDIDECKTENPCDVKAECINTPGSFVCVCKPGYTGDGLICSELDMCKSYNYCQQKCSPTPGSYSCSCEAGFVLQEDQTNCKSVMECSGAKVCTAPAYCVVDNDSEQCLCPTGYILNSAKDGCDKLSEVDVCSKSPCDQETTTCKAIGPIFACVCKEGYYRPPEYGSAGYSCLKKTTCTKPCATTGGECIVDGSGNYKCVCRNGYRGDGLTCIVDDFCSGNTKCDDQNAVCQHTYTDMSFQCVCPPGYNRHVVGDLGYCDYHNDFLYKGVITIGFPEKLSKSMAMDEQEIFIGKDLGVVISKMFQGYIVNIEPNLKYGEVMVYIVALTGDSNLVWNVFNDKLNTECLKNIFSLSKNDKKYCMIGSVIVQLGIKPAFNYEPCKDLRNNCNTIVHDCVDQNDPKNGMYCRCKKHFITRGLSYNVEICDKDEKRYCDAYPPPCDKPLQECLELTDGYECRCIKNSILDNKGSCVDICYNITCYNDGECVDGNCICPEEYLGKNCERKNPFERQYMESIDSIKTLTTAMGIVIILFLGSLVFMIEKRCNRPSRGDSTNARRPLNYTNRSFDGASEEYKTE